MGSSTAQEEILKVFRQFGEVHSSKITHHADGVSKGVAVVVMALKEHAEAVLEADEEVKISGMPIKVQWTARVKQEMGLPVMYKGQDVIISGLISAPEFNGMTGRVQRIRSDGRCEVVLQHGSEAKTLALKSDNL